jgi:DNA-binding winged helix-turn-helix (wHTH) protein/tetratricopeptide (TPR) repeat protein
MRFTLDDIELNLTTGIITKEDKQISVRAKTLLVLKHLIANKEEIVTKQDLLGTIWHDVVVQDQVLVQSIKEIRDILGSQVIKTYPRQGYQWTAELTATAPKSLSKNASIESPLTKRNIFIFIAFLTLVTTIFIYTDRNNTESTTPREQVMTVAFLPVKNDMPDDIHDWVPVKGTQYLNQRLQQQSSLITIEQTQLIELLSNQDISKLTHSPQYALSLQHKTSTDLIIQTSLQGYPQDFQLNYTLYLPHSVERGIEFADTVEKAFDQLVEKIALRFDDFTPHTATTTRNDFSNEAFARGIEFYLLREYSNAIAFFSSALQSNPDLLVARRYLAACYINTNDVEQGLNLMQKNIKKAQQKQAYREEIRSYLLIGVSLMNWHEANNTLEQSKLSQAQSYIESARSLAQTHHDSLFIAYAHEELGKIQRLQKNYSQAIELQQTALTFHQSFRGSYGQTNALIELARIANEQGNVKQSDNYFEQATTIANKNGVTTNQVAILLARADIKKAKGLHQKATDLATKALSIANKAPSHLLVTRVNAWLNDNNYYEIN